MPIKFDERQKSLKRRFLLILGAITGLCVLWLAYLITFGDEILPQLSGYQRIGAGALIALYAVIRFSRLLKKDPDEV